MLNSIKIKSYRGAHILILNSWQEFIVIVFYKNQFYHFLSGAEKKGEYTNDEYFTVIDTITKDSHKYIDAIILKRSLKFKIKQLWQQINKLFIAKARKGRHPMARKPN